MTSHAQALDAEQTLWAAASMAQLNRLAFSRELFLQHFTPPYAFAQLPAMLTQFGLRVRARHRIASLAGLRLPCLLALQVAAPDPLHQQDDAPASSGLAILTRVDGDMAWLFRPEDRTPHRVACKDLLAQMTGETLECMPAAPIPADPDQHAGNAFGFAWFIPALLRHKAIGRDVLLASLVIQLIALATPLFTQAIIDKVVVHQTTSTLAVITVALLACILFTAALTWVRQYLVLHTGNRIDAELGVTVFQHLLKLPLRYFEHRPTGVIAARLQAVETVREFIASSLVTLLLDLPFMLVFVAVMFFYSVPLTLLVLAILALIALLSAAVAPLFRRRLDRQFLLGARNQAFLTEHIAAMETVKSLQMEGQLARRYQDDLLACLQAGFETRQLGNTYSVVAGVLEQLMTLLVLAGGAWMVMQGAPAGGNEAAFTIGMLVAFQMFAGKLSQPLMRVVGLWQQFQQASMAMRRLADVMDAPAEPYAITPAREAARHGRIEIADLAFRHGDDRPLLYQGFNLTIAPGTTTALLGASGSGKSTLAKLMLGFYQPSAGRIAIDGVDIRHLAANELRATFGVVPQETVLFSGTVLDNLLAGNPHASFAMVVEACRMADIHRTIEALPRAYQTEIGERGGGLSGGQKQRIAIARALLKRPRVLIFDEATSALDQETAEHFARTVNALRSRLAILFITHQLPGSLQVDGIVRLGPAASQQPAPREERTSDA
jgi:subfamily B ATP-binding cassette protein HlyB/CyaB